MFNFSLFKNYCTLTEVPTSQSKAGAFLKGIFEIWADFWPYILIALCFIVGSELLTRHRNKYNSANGFTPDFNRLVGSATYMLLQILVYVIVRFFVGDVAYCLPWPYFVHLAVFSLNFTILHAIGFWPEKKTPKRNKWKPKRK